MKVFLGFCLSFLITGVVHAETLSSQITEFGQTNAQQIVLQNDSFIDGGGQAYLQLGFVTGEKVGVFVRVPENIAFFKVEYFRVLIGSSTIMSRESDQVFNPELNTQVFFEMGVADEATVGMPAQIINAAQITPGPYWNDIPAQGAEGMLKCARGGEVVGAALEFTHTGSPSVYRDLDGLANVKYNTLMAIPGGWNYSAAYGLRGDWILRIVGHEATPDEC